MTMTKPTDIYRNYLLAICPHLSSIKFDSFIAATETTNWEDPQTATDFNNIAVIALIEAEQSHDLSLRSLYFQVALESLETGWELDKHPLCAAHLSFLLSRTGQTQEALVQALSAWLITLEQAERISHNNNECSVNLIYFPPITEKFSSNLIAKVLQEDDDKNRFLMILSQALCYSRTTFYNESGIRWLYNAYPYFSATWQFCLKLGVYSITRQQWEGMAYLYKAKELNSDHHQVLQSLYLAYKTLGNKEFAKYWLNTAIEKSGNNNQSLDWRWTQLEQNIFFTYLSFENSILLAVQGSLTSAVTSVLMAEGDWFESELEFWRNRIEPGMTVIDVGANVGVYTFSAAKRVGSTGQVLAVEPFSGCIQCLEETRRINNFDWVKIYAGAASDHLGQRKLAIHTANEINTIIDDDWEIEEENIEIVNCFTLDSLIESESLEQVDFIKIDAEGHELAVLMGSQKILSQYSPTIIYENIAGSQNSNLIVANYLIDQGYLLFIYQPFLQNLIPIENQEDLKNCLNIIAIPNNKLLTEDAEQQETGSKDSLSNVNDLGMNNVYSPQDKVLYCGWDQGFFSNCTVAFWGIIDLYNRGVFPRMLNFSQGFNAYRTPEQISNQVNLYPYLFSVNKDSLINDQKYVLRHDHHGIYRNYDYSVYTKLINHYFNLSQEILDIKSQLIQKYDIYFSQLISVCYRGTDKFGETDLANPESYLKVVKQLLAQHPNYRILIQTDQQQVRELFMLRLSNQCFFIEEMPVSTGYLPLHQETSLLTQYGLDNFQFAKLILAVTHLLSQSQYIINHTGNVAAWICLFRGNSERVFQFDQKGVLIPPTK